MWSLVAAPCGGERPVGDALKGFVDMGLTRSRGRGPPGDGEEQGGACLSGALCGALRQILTY